MYYDVKQTYYALCKASTDRLTCWRAGSVLPKTNRLTPRLIPTLATADLYPVCHYQGWGLSLGLGWEGHHRADTVIGRLPTSFSTVIGIPILIRTLARPELNRSFFPSGRKLKSRESLSLTFLSLVSPLFDCDCPRCQISPALFSLQTSKVKVH